MYKIFNGDCLELMKEKMPHKTAKRRKKMNLSIVNKVEITTDKDTVNMLLERGWALLEVVANFKKEYSFLLVSCDESRLLGKELLKSK